MVVHGLLFPLTNLPLRAHSGNAKLAGLTKSITISDNDYNWALSIFFIGYVSEWMVCVSIVQSRASMILTQQLDLRPTDPIWNSVQFDAEENRTFKMDSYSHDSLGYRYVLYGCCYFYSRSAGLSFLLGYYWSRTISGNNFSGQSLVYEVRKGIETGNWCSVTD